MARTMDEMRDAASTWAHEVKTYENEKRRVLDEGFLRPPAMKLGAGAMKSKERVFDPLLQRYRDNGTEYKQRVLEETERINHLNRAKDIQVIREQPFHILHHESKFDALAPGQDPVRQPHQPRQPVGGGTYPTTQQDFNIVSNLPFDDHHWNRPEARQRSIERSGEQRKVHASRIRDFNIVTNRYPKDHEKKAMKEKELSVSEAAHKYMKGNRFDPLVQQFNDPRDEETAKHCDDAREVEVRVRAIDKIPPSYKGRHTEFYDVISNDVHNPEMVGYLQTVEKERKDRYRNRYIVEHNFHAQDVKGDHLREARKLNKVAPERFLECDRGYDVITGKGYGQGAKEQVHYSSVYAQPRKTPWEEIELGHSLNGRSASTPALPSAAAVDTRSERSAAASGRSNRSGDRAAAAPPPRGGERAASPEAASQHSRRSYASQRSHTLLEAGGRALSGAGSVSSAAQFREPPGATRPIPRAASTPVLSNAGYSPPPAERQAPMASVPEMSASAVRTRKMPSPMPLGESLGMTRAPPPAPMIPGSPMGSVYSRPSAKA